MRLTLVADGVALAQVDIPERELEVLERLAQAGEQTIGEIIGDALGAALNELVMFDEPAPVLPPWLVRIIQENANKVAAAA